MGRVLLIAACVLASLAGTACRRPDEAEIRGAARVAGVVWAWGDGLRSQPRPERVLLPGRRFAAAGCEASLDGSPGLILQESDRLIWLHGQDFGQTEVIDTGAGLGDCLAATLLGHTGVLVAHRGLQVRFYERPAEASATWPYREIYSFYTPSYQAGLLLQDVDRDGRPDIFCGNYWIQSPEEFSLPWRLFAINTYNDSEQAAHLRLGLWNGALLVAQGELHPAKLALFRSPADPKQLWTEERLDGALNLDHPAALALTRRGFALGERGGRGRLLWWGDARKVRLLGEGVPVAAVFADSDKQLTVVRRDGIRQVPLPLQ